MSKWASGKEQKSKSSHQAGRSKGFRQEEDEVQMPGAKGAGQIGRLDNEESAMVHEASHSSTTQDDGSEPARQSDI